MKHLPDKYIVDTNVPLTANFALNQFPVDADYKKCVSACIQVIERIIAGSPQTKIVLDNNNEIFDEYRNKLCLSGRPGLGDAFVKWVHDNGYSINVAERISITPTFNGNSYDEFPDHPDLEKFDPSDRKFIAVANAHPECPTIFQGTDSKWWGWRNALEEVGIIVHFLCPDYVKQTYNTKMGGGKNA